LSLPTSSVVALKGALLQCQILIVTASLVELAFTVNLLFRTSIDIHIRRITLRSSALHGLFNLFHRKTNSGLKPRPKEKCEA
jgi:hypothetical protein